MTSATVPQAIQMAKSAIGTLNSKTSQVIHYPIDNPRNIADAMGNSVKVIEALVQAAKECEVEDSQHIAHLQKQLLDSIWNLTKSLAEKARTAESALVRR